MARIHRSNSATAPGLMRCVAALLFMLAASGPATASASCEATEQELTGTWSSTSEHGFFKEFALAANANTRTFDSWLHQRPDILGATWALEDCHLVITPQRRESDPFRFKVLALERDKLRLRDDSTRVESVYRRILDNR